MRRLGIIRLERLFEHESGLSSQSTIINWVRAAAEACDAVGLVAPTAPVPDDAAPRGWWRPRPGDRVYPLPNASGYARVARISGRITLQITRLRREFRTVLCRAPEHGNFVVMPLLNLLGFRPVVWLVADRAEMRKVHAGRRGTGAWMRIALGLSDLNDAVERRWMARWPVIANGSELAAYARGLAPGRRDVLPVVSTTFRAEDRPAQVPAREHDGPVRLLYVGRLAPDKGLGTLVAALGIVHAAAPGRVELRIAGWAAHGEEERVREEVRAHGVEDVVRFLGPQAYGPELFGCFRDADLFVLPSPSEGTPRVLVEAMMFGLPIVATRVGGVPDLVDEGTNGLLVPPNDPAAMAAALQVLLDDPGYRARMAQANHAAGAAHTVEALAERMMSFIFPDQAARDVPAAAEPRRRPESRAAPVPLSPDGP